MSVAPYEPVYPQHADEPADPARRRPRSVVVEIVVSLVTGVVIAGLGAPIGLLWRAVAPRVELVQTDYGPYPLDAEPEGYIGDDGTFLFIAVGAGVVFAVLVWFLLRRFRGPIMLAALVLGSVGGSVLAAWVGHRVGLATYQRLVDHAPAGTHFKRLPNLRLSDVGLWFGFVPRVRGIVLVQGLVAAALYTACAGFAYSPDLRLDGDGVYEGPAGPAAGPLDAEGASAPVSWDSPDRTDQTAPPAPPALHAADLPPDEAWRAPRADG
jgi:hypothetical protein